MINAQNISSEMNPADNKGWEDTREVDVTLRMETKEGKRIFKGKIYKVFGVNIIE